MKDIKRKILGENAARLHGIDIEALRRLAQGESLTGDGLREPWSVAPSGAAEMAWSMAAETTARGRRRTPRAHRRAAQRGRRPVQRGGRRARGTGRHVPDPRARRGRGHRRSGGHRSGAGHAPELHDGPDLPARVQNLVHELPEVTAIHASLGTASTGRRTT